MRMTRYSLLGEPIPRIRTTIPDDEDETFDWLCDCAAIRWKRDGPQFDGTAGG